MWGVEYDYQMDKHSVIRCKKGKKVSHLDNNLVHLVGVENVLFKNKVKNSCLSLDHCSYVKRVVIEM